MPISDRGRWLVAALLVTGCQPTPGGNVTELVAGDEKVACARGEAPLAPTCTVERTLTRRGPMLTLRHEDGSFRRLLVTRDGRGVVAADGAEPARVTLAGTDRIEASVGDDHYLLPTTIGHHR